MCASRSGINIEKNITNTILRVRVGVGELEFPNKRIQI